MNKLSNSHFKHRRDALMQQLPEGCVAVIQSAKVFIRNGDVEHDFRQDSSFYYLSGMVEAHSTLVLSNTNDGQASVVFCQAKDKSQEIWHGKRLGIEQAPKALMVDEAFASEDLEHKLLEMLDGATQVVYKFSDEHTHNLVHSTLRQLKRLTRQGKSSPRCIEDLDPIINEMRLIKSEAEVEQMSFACDISVAAHKRAMTQCRPGMNEYVIGAELQHEFSTQGSARVAYGSIVAGGDNACILHYTNNDQPLKDGDLVLIDAGCELDHYASDITRTFPVNGKFSESQKTIYEIVLAAHQAALKAIKPGAVFTDLQEAAVQVITSGLIKIGLLAGSLESNLEEQSYRKFYMHNIGHWLGMDVHDVGAYKTHGQSRALKPGMVTTVEPGIYIDPEDHDIDPKWRGIGVRIEDDILITKTGYRNLTEALPVSVEDIESLMAQ
jgi:Xaa-Pro aminopeptidase